MIWTCWLKLVQYQKKMLVSFRSDEDVGHRSAPQWSNIRSARGRNLNLSRCNLTSSDGHQRSDGSDQTWFDSPLGFTTNQDRISIGKQTMSWWYSFLQTDDDTICIDFEAPEAKYLFPEHLSPQMRLLGNKYASALRIVFMSLLLLILRFHQISGKQFLVELADSSKKDIKSWGGKEESQKTFEDKLKNQSWERKTKVAVIIQQAYRSVYICDFFHPTLFSHGFEASFFIYQDINIGSRAIH